MLSQPQPAQVPQQQQQQQLAVGNAPASTSYQAISRHLNHITSTSLCNGLTTVYTYMAAMPAVAVKAGSTVKHPDP